MDLSALNGQRKRYRFIDDNKCVFYVARPEDEVHFFISCPFLVIPRQELMTCAREILGEHLYTSNIQLSETEKKNLVGIFINGLNTLSLEENIKLFSAVQKFVLNSGRFTYDANN